MKRYLFFLTAGLALTALNSSAQDSGNDAAKAKKKGREEIIIKKDDKDKKTVIIIEDGKVTINGKPVEDWKDGSVTIRDLKEMRDLDQLRVMRDDEPMNFRFFQTPDDQSPRQFKLLQDVYDQRKVRLGVYSKENDKGAEITRVIDSSAAAKAGLQRGDIITKVGDSPISDPNALSKVVRDHEPNDKLTVHYLRDGKDQETQVTLDKPKQMTWTDLKIQPDMHFDFRPFGGRPRLGAHIQDTEDTSGVKVLQIDPESPAATAGLQKDDIITSIDGKKVNSIDEAMDILGDEEGKFAYPLTVTRGSQSLTLQVKIPHELRSANL